MHKYINTRKCIYIHAYVCVYVYPDFDIQLMHIMQLIH